MTYQQRRKFIRVFFGKSVTVIIDRQIGSLHKNGKYSVRYKLNYGHVPEITGEDGVVTDIEYEIDFTGKSSEEISLITEYLKYIEYLGKWDGELPSVMTGDSASIMLPVDPTK